MNTFWPQRPIGFAPSEISARVNEGIVSRHAEEAAFLWTQRNRAVDEPHYSLKDLSRLDERVEAHLDGLRLAGEVGLKHCRANLEHGSPGEVFALAVLAFGAGRRDQMIEALNAGCASIATRQGLVSALGWLDYSTIEPWNDLLLEARLPLHRSIGIAACAVQRADPGPALALAIGDSDPTLRARALRAVGELKRQDLLDHLHSRLRDEDEACRFWAAWSLTLNGERAGLGVLSTFLGGNQPFAIRALQVALRAHSIDQSRALISTLAKEPTEARLAVMGAGIAGDPAAIPWLIRKMESPELARLAGESFSMITGVDLAFSDLDQDGPVVAHDDLSIEEVLDLDYESNLAWPSASRVTQWWGRNAQGFTSGVRYLAGKPITSASARETLSFGKQRQRFAAAVELALLWPDRPLFEVRARGDLQQRKMDTWTS